MTPKHENSDSGYSPAITIELHLHGERFNVASVGSDMAILRDARPSKPGIGVVRVNVDGDVTNYEMNFLTGIDPQREAQPFVLIGVKSDAAA